MIVSRRKSYKNFPDSQKKAIWENRTVIKLSRIYPDFKNCSVPLAFVICSELKSMAQKYRETEKIMQIPWLLYFHCIGDLFGLINRFPKYANQDREMCNNIFR